jgi:acetyltransferase
MVIGDAWQKRGLGTQLLTLLLRVAKDENIEWLSATIMAENLEMIRVAEKLGFGLTRSLTDSTVGAELDVGHVEDGVG